MMTLMKSYLKAAIRTKGGSEPSGLDADGLRRIIVSSCFGTVTSDLRKAIPELVKKLCMTNKSNTINCASLESLVACRLIPLSKSPGLRPIGVGEIFGKISGKVVMMISKQDFMKAAGSLQVCVGQEAGAEAAIHAVHDIFKDHTTEAVLLIDAESTFNAIARKAMLHNISVICPIISTYISNCFNTPSCLSIIWGTEILFEEGTTQMGSKGDGSLCFRSYTVNTASSRDNVVQQTLFQRNSIRRWFYCNWFN